MLLTHLFENKHMTEADIASVNWNTDSKQDKLNEFAPGAGGDDEAGDDPYKYPKPKRYNRSADYFEQFQADHFDREDFDDDTGVFKGYWGSKQIAYFKFDNPARTGGNNPGMGWYYEPQSDGRSNDTTANPAVDNADERKQQELDMIRAFLKSGNRPNPDSQIGRLMKKHGMTEGAEQQLSVQQLAAISDEALDKAYGYGRSTPGNTFGWQANLKSAQYAKQMIDKGVTDIEAISDAIHKGWNVTAQAFVQNPEQFDDTAKLQAAGKLEAKLQQRAQLMKQNYAQLPDEEKEKDRVVARALLQALKGQQGVAEGYQLDEGAIETITALVKKIPGIGKYYQMAQQYKPQLIEILKTSKSGKEVKQKMEQLAAGQSATVAESGMMKQLGGLAVGGGSILSTMWMNAMGMIDGVLAHAAAGEVGGAVASGSILGLIPVTLMLFAAMLMFKGSNQSSDEKAQAFQAQRGQQGVAEGLDEAVGGNYLYHGRSSYDAKDILSSGMIPKSKTPQSATDAQTQMPNLSVTRDWGYASGANASDQLAGIGRDIVFVLDRNAVESNFKTLGTSQSTQIKGLAFNPYFKKDGQARSQNTDAMARNIAKAKAKNAEPTTKAGGEFEEVVVIPKGALPLKGTMVGFWVNPKSELMKDPAIMNDPRRLDMVRPNQFVKATKQGVAEGDISQLEKDVAEDSENAFTPLKLNDQKSNAYGNAILDIADQFEDKFADEKASEYATAIATVGHAFLNNGMRSGRARLFGLEQAVYKHVLMALDQQGLNIVKDLIRPHFNPDNRIPFNKMAEGDISQLEKDVADAPVEPIANMEATEKVGNMDADAFDAAMARLKKLAGAGPLKTVWDPAKRVYKNVPTAVQPKK